MCDQVSPGGSRKRKSFSSPLEPIGAKDMLTATILLELRPHHSHHSNSSSSSKRSKLTKSKHSSTSIPPIDPSSVSVSESSSVAAGATVTTGVAAKTGVNDSDNQSSKPDAQKTSATPLVSDSGSGSGEVEEKTKTDNYKTSKKQQHQQQKQYPALDKPFLKLSTKATVMILKKFLMRKLNVSDPFELQLFCSNELLGNDHSLHFISKTCWHHPVHHLVITYQKTQ